MPAIFDPKATSVPVLRYLVALAEHRHFGRAAAACAVSQGTLSEQVAAWERRLGVRVFDREAMRPTPEGERIATQARRALDELERLEALAAPGAAPFYGPVTVGVIQSLGAWLLPLAGPAVERAFPGLAWPVREGLTANLLGELGGRSLDCAVLALLPGMDEAWQTMPLFAEPFLAALPRRHPLAKRRTVDPAALADPAAGPLLLLDDGHCLRGQALSACGLRSDRGTGADYRATSLETLRQLVALGRGTTLLPALAAVPDPRIALRPLAGEAAHRVVGLAWRRGDHRAAGFRQLGAAIRSAVPSPCRPLQG